MAKSRLTARQSATKPIRRNPLKKATAQRAMPLRTPDPVRTTQIKSRKNGAKQSKRKQLEAAGPGSTTLNNHVPLFEWFMLFMRWSPLGIFIRQQAARADTVGLSPRTSQR